MRRAGWLEWVWVMIALVVLGAAAFWALAEISVTR